MKVKFREIANFVAGQSPKSEYYSESDGVPFLQGNRTFGTFHPTIDTYTTKTTKIANKGDILMSVRAPVGDLNFAPVDLCIGRGLAAITAKDGDNAFLFYALKYNINNLLKQSNGTTYDSVTGDIVKEMDMIIPEDKSVCKKISKLLYTIDSKIENNKQTMAELESMAKTIYDYWFLQYEFPNEEGKPYKSSGGKMEYNEELKKEIPEGWKVNKAGEVISVVRGISYKPKDEIKEINKDTISLLKSNNIQNGSINFEQPVYLDKKMANEEQWLTKGSVFITMSSGSKAHMGKTAIVYETLPYVYGAFCAKINIKPSHCGFISTYFRSSHFRTYIENVTLGTSINNISNDQLTNIKLAFPEERVLEKFEKIIKPIFEKQGKIIFENQELTKLRDELLPLLMNGQVGFKE